MGLEENKSVVRRVYQLCTEKNLTELFDCYDPVYIEHTSRGDLPLEALKQTTQMFFSAFPDSSFTVLNMVAEGDKVAYQIIIKGTHQGPFMGLEPTGRKIEMHDTSIKRILGGKFRESWGTIDSLSLMQQLGLIPKP